MSLRLPTSPGPVDAELTPPPSKSITHRALIVASLARGRTRIADPLHAEDTLLTRDALRRLGAGIEEEGEDWIVDGSDLASGPLAGEGLDPLRLELGNSGSSLRLLAPVAALGRRTVILDGSPRLRERPVGALVDALRQLGVEVLCPLREGFPPLHVRGPLAAGRLVMDASESSQGVSGLLLAGAAAGGMEISVRALSSRPYVGLTRDVARAFGVEIHEPSPDFYVVKGAPPRPLPAYRVEADASAAAFLLAAAAVTGGRVRVKGVSPGSAQGDAACLALLERMGCVTRSGADWMEAAGPLRRGIEADFNATPDLVPPFAAVALHAPTTSRLHGIAHLRHKESDRIAALSAEAARLRARVQAGEGDLVFHPGPLTGTAVLAHGDHRIAMAMAIVALRLKGMTLDDPACVAKSYPAFFEDLDRLIATAGPALHS